MKFCCWASVILALCNGLDDSSVLIQQHKPALQLLEETVDRPWDADWADRINEEQNVTQDTEQGFQVFLIKLHKVIRARLVRLHERLDNAEMILAEKRHQLDEDIAGCKNKTQEAAFVVSYLSDTLPLWQSLTRNGSQGLIQIMVPLKGQFDKQQFVSDWLDQTNKSMSQMQSFIDSMAVLHQEWVVIEFGHISEQEAIDGLAQVARKTKEGLQVFKQAEKDFTQSFDKFSAKVDQLNVRLHAGPQTIHLVDEVTNLVHQECHSVGRKLLDIFGEMVGATDDAYRNLKKRVVSRRMAV